MTHKAIIRQQNTSPPNIKADPDKAPPAIAADTSCGHARCQSRNGV